MSEDKEPTLDDVREAMGQEVELPAGLDPRILLDAHQRMAEGLRPGADAEAQKQAITALRIYDKFLNRKVDDNTMKLEVPDRIFRAWTDLKNTYAEVTGGSHLAKRRKAAGIDRK